MAMEKALANIKEVLSGRNSDRFRQELQEILSGARSGAAAASGEAEGEMSARRTARRTRPPVRLSPSSPRNGRRRSPSAERQRTSAGAVLPEETRPVNRSGAVTRAAARKAASGPSRQARVPGRRETQAAVGEQSVAAVCATDGSRSPGGGGEGAGVAGPTQLEALPPGPRLDQGRPMESTPGRLSRGGGYERTQQARFRRSRSRGRSGSRSRDPRWVVQGHGTRRDRGSPRRQGRPQNSGREPRSELSRNVWRDGGRSRSERRRAGVSPRRTISRERLGHGKACCRCASLCRSQESTRDSRNTPRRVMVTHGVGEDQCGHPEASGNRPSRTVDVPEISGHPHGSGTSPNTARGGPGTGTLGTSGQGGESLLDGLKGFLASWEDRRGSQQGVARVWGGDRQETGARQGPVAGDASGPVVTCGSVASAVGGTPGKSAGEGDSGNAAERDKEKEVILGGVAEVARQNSYVSFAGPVGVHLKLETKEKIWKGEFVEIFSLLPLEEAVEVKEDDKKEGKKEEEERAKRYRKIPKTFGNWLRAFCILAGVIGEKHPQKCSALFCYLDGIWEAFRVYGGLAWWRYDEQFRQRLAANPGMRWDQLDMTLWMRLMLAQKVSPFPRPAGGEQSSSSSAGHKLGFCWMYNDGHC
ncbi:hypothetical protein XELAEV_18031757mg, partial [Xenopus laevis]